MMLHNCYSNQLSTDCYYADVMCHGTSSQATQPRSIFPELHNSTMHPISSAQKENILSLASNGLSIHQIASKLVLEDLLHPGYSRISFLINLSLLLVVPLSFLLTLSSLSSLKLPLEGLLMLFKPPNTSIPSSPIQSPQRQSEESLGRTHSRLWWRRKSHFSVQCIGRSAWALL